MTSTSGLLCEKTQPFQHPVLGKTSFPNPPAPSFFEFLETCDAESHVNLIPQLFNNTWDFPSVQGKDVVVFGDCEKQGAPDDLPISLYCYCLNTGSNIYLKLRPDNLYVGKKPLEVHGITADMILKHHLVPVKEGISSLVGWMKSQSNDQHPRFSSLPVHTVEFHNNSYI